MKHELSVLYSTLVRSSFQRASGCKSERINKLGLLASYLDLVNQRHKLVFEESIRFVLRTIRCSWIYFGLFVARTL